jgi:hypothetical protein
VTSAVQTLHQTLSDIVALLLQQAQPSLAIDLEELHRKALLLSAASYFEFKLAQDLLKFVERAAGEDSPVFHLVRTKAVSRQYHTWFQWDGKNANSFFALFGGNFKSYMEEVCKSDTNLVMGIKEFLSLGSDRNRLVHSNFGSFALEATPAEIMDRFERAEYFVAQFEKHLNEFVERERSAQVRSPAA